MRKSIVFILVMQFSWLAFMKHQPTYTISFPFFFPPMWPSLLSCRGGAGWRRLHSPIGSNVLPRRASPGSPVLHLHCPLVQRKETSKYALFFESLRAGGWVGGRSIASPLLISVQTRWLKYNEEARRSHSVTLAFTKDTQHFLLTV